MKRTTVLVSFTLALVLFSGCMLGGSESKLERRLLKLMKNKYDVEFTIVEDSYEEYSLTNVLVATLSPVDNPDIQCTGSINTIGLFEDNYSTALLQDQLKEYYSVLCDQEYVFDYDINIDADNSDREGIDGIWLRRCIPDSYRTEACLYIGKIGNGILYEEHSGDEGFYFYEIIE